MGANHTWSAGPRKPPHGMLPFVNGAEAAEDGWTVTERRRLVYRWDLDKTYLRTEFDSLRDLVRTAFEPASRKLTVPGAASLLRELKATEPAGVYILSGSPEQMRKVLEAKLRLDGVHWDSFTLKPSLRNMLRGRFRFLRDQVGYKLAALLASRSGLAAETDEVLFGDDAEADAFIYSLYADICAGRASQHTLLDVLEQARVHEEERPRILQLAAAVPRRDACRRIFIHLDRISSPEAFAGYGTRVCPFYNYLQPALVLLEAGAIDADAALRLGAELVISHAFSPQALTASYMDLARRGQLGRRAAERLVAFLPDLETRDFATATPVLKMFCQELEAALDTLERTPPVGLPTIDYAEMFARDRARARAAKLRAVTRR